MISNHHSTTVNCKSTLAERQAALYQIYRQVLERQPYGYERRALAKAEKDFLNDKIGVRRFLKELGQSEVYLNAFYYKASNLKFLEWCFKHFMGRAPIDQAEVRLYCDILMQSGVKALITALLDSEEYRKFFGCFTVPYPREQITYSSPNAYLESQILNHEYIEQRGHVLPTLYWHQLGLNCDAGTCRHPEADEVLNAPPARDDRLANAELQELLKALKDAGVDQPREWLTAPSALSEKQVAALRRAIRR